MLKIEKDIKASSKNYSKMTNKKNEFIIIHGTGHVAPLDNFAKNLHDNVVGGSAHYFVKDDRIRQVIDDTDSAWAIGNAHGWYKVLNDKAHNSNSISIEMLEEDEQGHVSAATITTTGELVKMLMKKYNINKNEVIRHGDVLNKSCPQYYMHDKRWELLKKELVSEKYSCRFIKKNTYGREKPKLSSKHLSTLVAGEILKVYGHSGKYLNTNKGYVLEKRTFSGYSIGTIKQKTYGRYKPSMDALKLFKLNKGNNIRVYGLTPNGEHLRTNKGYVLVRRVKF